MGQGVSPSRGSRNIRRNVIENKMEQTDEESLAFSSRLIVKVVIIISK